MLFYSRKALILIDSILMNIKNQPLTDYLRSKLALENF